MYQPILRSMPGEMEAWEKVSNASRMRTVPLFELEFKSKATLDEQLVGFAKSLFSGRPAGEVVAVDSKALGYEAVHSVIGCSPNMFLAFMAEPNGIGVRPVVRMDDPVSFVRDAILAAQNTKERITLRVDRSTGSSLTAGTNDLQAFCNSAAVLSSEIHLLIDFGSVYGADVGSLSAEADAVLAVANSAGPWASVTLASGAFPPNITALAKGVRNTVPRLDADLWNSVSSSLDAGTVFFGDYGIRYPDMDGTGGAPRGPLPNLKYCTSNDWIVWREQTLVEYPNSSFYAVCAGIVAQAAFSGPNFSWGDGIIHAKSTCHPGPKGAGTGQQWITYALNHHLEFVIDRLSTLGVA